MQLDVTAMNASLQQAQDEFREIEQRMSQALTDIQIERNRVEQYEQQHDQMMEERTRLHETGQEVVQRLEALREQLVQTHGEIESLAISMAEGEESLEEMIVRRREIEQKVDQGREAILAVAVEKTNLDNRLRSLGEGQGATSRRIERLVAEFTQSKVDQTTLESEHETLQAHRSTLESQLDELRANQEQLEVRLQSHRESREDLDNKILEYQTQMAGTDSELRALQGIFREELGFGQNGEGSEDSIRQQCSLIQAALAERMEVDEEVEQAIEVALGDHLQAWIVNSPQEAQESIAQFQQHQLGKGRFLPLQIPRSHDVAAPTWWAALEHEPSVKGLAKTFVQAPTDLKAVVDGLLQDTVIVGSLDDALAIMDKYQWFQGNGPTLVTLNGVVVSSLGVLSGGLSREAGGLLRRRREILALEENLQILQTEFATVQETRKTLCQDIETVSSQFEEAISRIRDKEFQVLSVQKEEMSKEQALPDLRKRLDILQQEREMEETECAQMRADEVEARAQLEHLEHRRAEEDRTLGQSQETLRVLAQEQEDLTARLNDIRKNYHTLNAQWSHEQSNKERLEQEEENGKIRVQEIDQQLEQLFLQSRTSQEKRLQNEELVEGLGGQKESKGEQLRDLQNQHAGILEEVKRLDSLIGRARESLAQIFKSRGPIEGHLAEVRTKLHAVEETLTQTYEISIDDLKISNGSWCEWG